MDITRTLSRGRQPSQFVGGWEAGLLALMLVLYIGGVLINPAFFGSTDALQALLRDTARYGVMAVGMTFVIVSKDIDLSVGSTFGLVGVAFSILFSPTHYDLPLWAALLFCLFLGATIGLANGLLVTALKVPGIHCNAHHAADRPRPRARPHWRQEHLLSGQGPGKRLVLPSQRNKCLRF